MSKQTMVKLRLAAQLAGPKQRAATVAAGTSQRLGLGARLALALALALAASLALTSTPAMAEYTHQFSGSFDGGDAPGGPFGFVTGIAADTSGGADDGDVYVAGSHEIFGSGAVDKFDADGNYAGVHIDGAATPDGSFSFVPFPPSALGGGIAVDGSSGPNSGDLYIPDIGHGVVNRFDASGAYECQITGAGSPSGSECNGAAGSETPAGGLTPAAVAVDSAGHVYVADAAQNAVYEFGPAGDYVREISDPHITAPARIAVDPAGALYVSNFGLITGSTTVVKLDSSGAFAAVIDDRSPNGVAIDPATGHIYVYEDTDPSGQIAEHDADGVLLTRFGAGHFSQQLALALAVGSTGKVYVGQFESPGAVDIFGPGVRIPDVSTGDATAMGQTSAKLNGSVDPDAPPDATSCEFEYGTDASYGQSANCDPAPPYASPTEVTGAIAGLTPNTTYHYRLTAGNANGDNQGEDRTFITRGPPTIADSSAEGSTTKATLSAQINPFGYPTNCRVEYIDQAGFQASGYDDADIQACDTAELEAGFGDQRARSTLEGLNVGTTYHFRFVATNEAGQTVGADQQFATFGIDSFSAELTDSAGQPYTQAGGHPYEFTTSIGFNTTTHSRSGEQSAAANFKDAIVALPPGLVGNPTATPRCTRADLVSLRCSGAAQVGLLSLTGSLNGGGSAATVPLYNLVTPAGSPAMFGAWVNGGITAYIRAKVRTGDDYGLTAAALSVAPDASIWNVSVTMWGVPADSTHDDDRFCPSDVQLQEQGCASGAPAVPFLSLPTSCRDLQTVRVRADAWQGPGEFVAAESTLPATTGCERLDFTPSIAVQPSSARADSPSGLDVDLKIPQNGLENPDGLATAHLKRAVVNLPKGMAVNPSAADGLGACSPAQIALESAQPDSCPSSSKIGSVEIETPLLDHPLKGGIHLATQDDNPFNSTLALYLAVNDRESGVVIKLPGKVEPDPDTGRLTTTFDDNPQLPFNELRLHFKSGPRAPIVTPPTCGIKQVISKLAPWSAADPDNPTPEEVMTDTDAFEITSAPNGKPCVDDLADRGFEPEMSSGVVNPVAASSSPFVLRLTRDDGDQEIDTLSVTPPEGVSAVLKNAEQCSDTDIAANDCPEESLIGQTIVGAGAGPSPFYIQGDDAGSVYMAGPYDPDGNGPRPEAPLSLDIQVPAVAGPFDLGIVNVRSAIYVNKRTAQLTIESDPLPQILEGIPLRVRDIRVKVDKPGYMLAPTDCDPKSVEATVKGINGASADLSNRFQVGDCAALDFSPKLRLNYRGKGAKKRNSHPRLAANLKIPQAEENFDSDTTNDTAKQTNLDKVRVVLPRGTFLDQGALSRVCTPTQWEASNCPSDSKIGNAKAWSPILKEPLKGPVYLKVGPNKLPDLAADLDGIVDIDLFGKIDQSRGRIRNTFQVVPDVPVEKFRLNLKGGDGGLLVNSKDICKGKKRLRRANVAMSAHSGAKLKDKQSIVRCGGKKRKGRRR